MMEWEHGVAIKWTPSQFQRVKASSVLQYVFKFWSFLPLDSRMLLQKPVSFTEGENTLTVYTKLKHHQKCQILAH